MKNRVVTILLILAAFANTAFAQKAKLGTAFAQITESSMRKEARMGDDPEVFYSFKVNWKSNATPESIFFKSPEAWANCLVIKDGREIYPDDIKKGNKISFKTMNGGKFAIPEELNAIKAPALFFQVKGKWYYLPVKNIKRVMTR